MPLVEAAAAGPVHLQAAALVPAQAPPADPVHQVPVVLLALAPLPLQAHLGPLVPAVDVMITVVDLVQRPKHRRKLMRKKDAKGAQHLNQQKFI